MSEDGEDVPAALLVHALRLANAVLLRCVLADILIDIAQWLVTR